MSVLPGPFSRTALALAVLLAAGQAGAAPDQGATTPAAKAAARAAVVAYNKQRQEAQQELSADDVKRVQGVGQVLLTAQAGMQDSPAAESLRAEVKSLHDELEQALAAASLPSFSNEMEVTDVTIETVEEPLRVNSQMRFENGKPVIVNGPAQKRDRSDGHRRTTRIDKDTLANRNGDKYARVRARLDAMRPRVEAASAAGQGVEKGGAGDRNSGHMAKKARQLGDEVRAAIDAKPSADSRRKLAELRDRLSEKNLDEVLGVSSTPVTPTFTTSIQHR